MNENKIQKQNVGNAGEYYIASRLSALDYTVTITLGRAEKYDILALSPKGKLIKISVKTTQVEKAVDFPLSVKDERGEAEDFYYALVKLNNFREEPDFWIIPSLVVCPLLKYSTEKYLKTPGKNNRMHKETTMRTLPFRVIKSQKQYYPENWEEEIKKYHKNLKQLL